MNGTDLMLVGDAHPTGLEDLVLVGYGEDKGQRVDIQRIAA